MQSLGKILKRLDWNEWCNTSLSILAIFTSLILGVATLFKNELIFIGCGIVFVLSFLYVFKILTKYSSTEEKIKITSKYADRL